MTTNATRRSGAQFWLVLVRITVVHFDVSSPVGVTADVGRFNCPRMSQYYVLWIVFSTQRNAENVCSHHVGTRLQQAWLINVSRTNGLRQFANGLAVDRLRFFRKAKVFKLYFKYALHTSQKNTLHHHYKISRLMFREWIIVLRNRRNTVLINWADETSSYSVLRLQYT